MVVCYVKYSETTNIKVKKEIPKKKNEKEKKNEAKYSYGMLEFLG